MKSTGINVSGLTVGAVINTSSGGCASESAAEMLDILNRAGVTGCKIWCGTSARIERAFAEPATHKRKILVVLGGTGSSAQLRKRSVGLTLIFSRFQMGR